MIADRNIYSGGSNILNDVHTNKEFSEDNDTVNRLIAGCSQSKEDLCTLYNMFKKSVFALAFSITADYQLSEDCVSETFVRLTQVKHFNAKKGDGKGYIFTVARNVALEIRRRYKRECNDMIIQSYGEADKTVEDSIYVNQLLKHLNDKQRQTVVLKCCNELTFKEIAKIMRCPETTVKSRYKKAMAILQEKAGANNEK